MKLYRLTERNCGKEGVTISATGKGEISGIGFIRVYDHPLIAVLMNPIHGNIDEPIMWEVKGEIKIKGSQLECACVSVTALRQIPIMIIPRERRIRFAILSAKSVSRNNQWIKWADDWLAGTDRTVASSIAAEELSTIEKHAAGWHGWESPVAAIWAAKANGAADYAYAAALAANAASLDNKAIDFSAIAEEACQ
jgi:hypothetical protein